MTSARPRSEMRPPFAGLRAALLALVAGALSACGPGPSDETPDAGPVITEPDAGTPPPTYCRDIKPILDRTCVSSCHGARTDGSGDDSFRLDVWETEEGVRGVKEMVTRIHLRASEYETMPPPDASAFPTFRERDLIAQWAKAGAPYCDP